MLLVFYFSPTLWVFVFFFPSHTQILLHGGVIVTYYLFQIRFFLRLYFLRIFLGSQQNQEGQIFHILPASIQTSRTVHMPHHGVRLFQLMNLLRHIIVTQSP